MPDKQARPGPLREAHAHIHQHGLEMSMLDISGSDTSAHCLSRVAERNAAMTRAGDPGWLLARGARPEAWREGDWPSLRDLDEATGDRPALLWCFDHHALMANSAALRASGVSEASQDPPGGVIRRDERGSPSGVLLEAAAIAAWRSAPEPTEQQRRAQVLAALQDLAAQGFTEVHDLKSPAWLGPMLASLDHETPLPVRTRLYPMLEDAAGVQESAAGWANGRITLGGAKLFADGTLNSRTAWMLEPYADPLPAHPRGTPMVSEAALEEAVRRADALGLPLATHAIGDAAVRAVLDAIERVDPRTGGFRIEHAEVIDAQDVRRFVELGVVCSVQPCHLLYDIEALERLLPHRLDRVLPLRELVDAGCVPGETLWFGSDVPIVRPDPGDSVHAAVVRGRAGWSGPFGGGSEAPVTPEQGISEAEAWACFGWAGSNSGGR